MAASALAASALSASADFSALDVLTGAQRAALFLLVLGDDYGKQVWSMLDEEEVRTITHAMVQLGTVDAAIVETLIRDFITRLTSSGVIGSAERTEALLLRFFPPEQVAAIMSEVYTASGRRIWARLSQVDPEILANYLRSEYPQTVAVILSKMRHDHAARVLTALPDEFAVDVISRMLRMEPVQKEALQQLEETLRAEFVGAVAQTAKKDAHAAMAEVFNAFDRQTESRFLAALDDLDRGAAKRIRELMFTFEDLTKLDPGSVQTLMRGLDRDTIARALKGASEPLREFFLSNMSTRAAKNLQDEMGAIGPIRLKEVDEAQSRIVFAAKELAEKGEIVISKNRAEEELVY